MSAEQIKRLTSTMKTGLGKNDPMPLRRHHDDDYWDEITVDAGKVHLRAVVMPRYKTSGLSGDEWRVSAKLEVTQDGRKEPLVSRGFGRMHRDLCAYAAHFVYQGAAHLLGEPDAVLVAKRKGVVLVERKFPFFGDAALGIGWHIVAANEGERGVEWHHLSDEEERQHCQQVGCSATPVNFYRLTKILYGDHPPDTFMVPKYDFEGQFVWYCARHTTRGDCGFEDADANLVLVKGNGVAREHEVDESPSGLAGVIDLSE